MSNRINKPTELKLWGGVSEAKAKDKISPLISKGLFQGKKVNLQPLLNKPKLFLQYVFNSDYRQFLENVRRDFEKRTNLTDFKSKDLTTELHNVQVIDSSIATCLLNGFDNLNEDKITKSNREQSKYLQNTTILNLETYTNNTQEETIIKIISNAKDIVFNPPSRDDVILLLKDNIRKLPNISQDRINKLNTFIDNQMKSLWK